MCELEINWVGVSDDVLHVVGRKGAGACPSINVSYILRDENGQTLLQDDEQAIWLGDSVWQAKFPIERGFRDRFCGQVQGGGEFRMPPYVVQARCQDCPTPVMYARELHCCPNFAIVLHRAEAACADPDQIGVLRRSVQIDWSITRRSITGDIHGRVVARWNGGEWRGPTRVLGAPIVQNIADIEAIGDESALFTDLALVPGGADVRIELEQDLPVPCLDVELPFIGIGIVQHCDCQGQPSHDAPFTVVGDSGEDLTQKVARGECVSSERVRISAPDDARGSRFEWLDDIQGASDDPYATDQAVPDTDEGVTVRAQIGSSPCGDEPRSVTVRRCQRRIAICTEWQLPCRAIEIAGVVSFYGCLVCMFTGLSCVLGGAARGVSAANATAGTVSSSVTTPNPASQLASVYGVLSSLIAYGLTSFGLGLIAASLIAFCLAIACWWYWVQCCAPRRWECRFLQNLEACLFAFSASTLTISMLILIILIIVDVTLSTLLGFSLGALFAFFISSVCQPIVRRLLVAYRCPGDRVSPIWKEITHGWYSV